MLTPQAIQWPEITAGGRRFVLRFAYSARYQLTRWGRTLADASVIEIAAACAGTFLPDGSWQSEGFDKAIYLADMMLPGEESVIVDAVAEAIKKAYPELEISTRTVPETSEATKTVSQTSTPSPFPHTD